MQTSKSTPLPGYPEGVQLTIRPEHASAILRLLAGERGRYVKNADRSAPEYLVSIQRIIDAVVSGQPIQMDTHMTTTEQMWSVEDGNPGMGSVAHYLRAAIRDEIESLTSDLTADDWRYLSDIAAVGAEVEPIFAAVWRRTPQPA